MGIIVFSNLTPLILQLLIFIDKLATQHITSVGLAMQSVSISYKFDSTVNNNQEMRLNNPPSFSILPDPTSKLNSHIMANSCLYLHVQHGASILLLSC